MHPAFIHMDAITIVIDIDKVGIYKKAQISNYLSDSDLSVGFLFLSKNTIPATSAIAAIPAAGFSSGVAGQLR